MNTKPIFETIEEYENYLDLLYEMIETKMINAQNELQYLNPFKNVFCYNCNAHSSINNKEYFQKDTQEKTYRDCLTFFKYAQQKSKRDKNIVNKILNKN